MKINIYKKVKRPAVVLFKDLTTDIDSTDRSGRPFESGSLEVRVAELRHHLKIEAAVADGAKNVVKQLSRRKVQDRRLLAEVTAAVYSCLIFITALSFFIY